VTFGERSVSLGNLFRVSECKTAPKISFATEVCTCLRYPTLPRPAPPSCLPRQKKILKTELIPQTQKDLISPQKYTLLLTDPDAPTPDDPKFAYWRHWVVSGLQPSESPEASAKTLTEYLGPGPKDE
jgi:hypothetical protein